MLQQRFRLAVGTEVLLGVLIIAVVGLLTSLEPGRDALRSQGLTRELQIEDVQATLAIAPATVSRFRRVSAGSRMITAREASGWNSETRSRSSTKC